MLAAGRIAGAKAAGYAVHLFYVVSRRLPAWVELAIPPELRDPGLA